jgi:chlorobactene glucosyltransferase
MLSALLWASPWIVFPAVTIWRVRRSRELADLPPAPPSNPPLVSVIIPARNERRNIESSVRSALGGNYSNLEVIVVDDRSSDGTGEIARTIAREDARVRVTETTPLPEAWFGKPWACALGAAAARGDIFCFTDADAQHGPYLASRATRAMGERSLDMLTIAGRQELGTFWEKVVQPHVFWMLASRYGGTESINDSRNAKDKIANGQCIFVRRSAYESIGGHGAVRDQVAEDVALAQRLFAAGKKTAVIMGHDELTTRMYTSLPEIMAGWRKNVFAGGREAMPWGRLGQLLFPVLLLVVPILTLLPPLTLAIGALLGASRTVVLAAGIATAAQLVTWALVYRFMRAPTRYAAIYPLGAIVFVVIALQAIARGPRVEWKGRSYVTSRSANTRR